MILDPPRFDDLICPECHTALISYEAGEQAMLACPAGHGPWPIQKGIAHFTRNEVSHDGRWTATYRERNGSGLWGWLYRRNAYWGVPSLLRPMLTRLRRRPLEIVDLGCGGGWEFLTAFGHVTGIDYGAEALPAAATVYHRIIRSTVDRVPIQSEAVDVVASIWLFEHLPEDQFVATLKEIRRILRPGGHLVFFTDLISSKPILRWAMRFPEEYVRHQIEQVGHYGLRSLSQTRTLLRQEGFVERETIPVNKSSLLQPVTALWMFNNELGRRSRALRWYLVGCQIVMKYRVLYRLVYLALMEYHRLIDRWLPEDYAFSAASDWVVSERGKGAQQHQTLTSRNNSPQGIQGLIQTTRTTGRTTLLGTSLLQLEGVDRKPTPDETSAAIQAGLDQAEGGRPLTRQQAALLLYAEGRHLRRLLELASDFRNCGKGRTVTFSKKVFIPLTRVCRDRCGYCAFRRDPGEPGDGFMTPDEVLAIASAGAALGCTEALFSLGERPELVFPEAGRALADRGYHSTIEYLARMCERTVAETGLLPHANPGTMSIEEMAMLRDTTAGMGLMLESVSVRLLQPGGPHHFSPDKHPLRRLSTIENAGRLRIAFTTGILIGIGESVEERIDALFAIRALHQTFGHIQEVIIQNFRAKPFTPMRDHPEPTPVDLLRTVAVARLILGPDMNIQAPPNLNPDTCPLLLLSGINDWGGISPLTQDHINPEAPWPGIDALRDATSAIGYRLQERLPIYPEYIVRRDGFIPAPLASTIMALVDEAGYPKKRV